jgi:hypothetical protein
MDRSGKSFPATSTWLHWRPESDLTLHIDDGVCSHALVSVDENHTVRVLPTGEKWSLPEVKAKLKEGRNLLSLPGSHADSLGFHSFVQRTGPAQSLLCAYWRMLTTARS